MDENTITFYEKDYNTEKENIEEQLQFIIFRLANEWYGVDVHYVKHVARVGEITFLPSAPLHVLGIVNFGGTILSVIDLRQQFGLSQEERGGDLRLIVIKHGKIETGILSDEVSDVMTMMSSEVNPVLHTIPEKSAEFIQGTFMVENKLVGVINVERVVEIEGNAL